MDAHIGFVPGFLEAHTRVKTLDELKSNFFEVVKSLFKDDRLKREKL